MHAWWFMPLIYSPWQWFINFATLFSKALFWSFQLAGMSILFLLRIEKRVIGFFPWLCMHLLLALSLQIQIMRNLHPLEICGYTLKGMNYSTLRIVIYVVYSPWNLWGCYINRFVILCIAWKEPIQPCKLLSMLSAPPWNLWGYYINGFVILCIAWEEPIQPWDFFFNKVDKSLMH